MELPSEILSQFVIISRPKIEEHMLVVMNRSTHEEHLSQPLQTKNKQFKKAVTFLTGCNGIFNVTSKNKKFCFPKSFTDENGYILITIPLGA